MSSAENDPSATEKMLIDAINSKILEYKVPIGKFHRFNFTVYAPVCVDPATLSRILLHFKEQGYSFFGLMGSMKVGTPGHEGWSYRFMIGQ